jgi:hypothetical protein
VVVLPASVSETVILTLKNSGVQDSAGLGAHSVKQLLNPIEMRAARLIGIARAQEPRCERFEILDVAILFVSGMDADENLFESRHRASSCGGNPQRQATPRSIGYVRHDG